MRRLTLPSVLIFGLASACTAAAPPEGPSARTNDCAVISAIAQEHYKFGPDNPPPPLRSAEGGEWRPDCDFSALGFAFTPYTDPGPASDPRSRLRWVSFARPIYDGEGALVETEIMHGPLAGIGYECRLHSGIAGWTVGNCKTSWVS